jgi:hypothetical protein
LLNPIGDRFSLDTGKITEWGKIDVPVLAAALAGSAADERERCEAIARAEAKRAVGFPRGFYAAENIANAIAALAEPKVGWTKAARSVWYKDASNPNAPEIVDDNLKLNE